MLRVGIDTLNRSKKYQHIFIGDVASFDYFGDATYNYSCVLYRSADSIIYHDGSVNGWADGIVSLIAIHYR